MADNMKPFRVLVVGAGATGSMVSCFLKRTYQGRVALEIWDKGRGAGGRMSTTRFERDSPLSFDLGAQYISASKEYKIKHKSVYDELSMGVLSPLTAKIDGMRNVDGTTHFVTPSGVSSIPKYFLEQAGASLKSNMHLSEVNVNKSVLSVRAFDNSIKDSRNTVVQDADAIVITIPIPQLWNLRGNIRSYLKPYRKKLEDVCYSSRYALGLFYPNKTDLKEVEWASKYIRDNPCLCFISVDTKKREKVSSEGLSIVAHASVPFSIKHLEDRFSDVEPIMLNHIQQEIPNLPKAARTKLIKWRYSQVTNSYDSKPGHIVLNESPLIILAGDAFTQSNFDGCVESALSVVDSFRSAFPLSRI